MKKTWIILLVIAYTMTLFTGCAKEVQEDQTADPTSESTAAETEETVVFTDPVLEAMVREAMGKSEGDITLEEAEAVTKMDLGIDWQQAPVEGTQIKDLSGIENFVNLEELGLHFHAITDIFAACGA